MVIDGKVNRQTCCEENISSIFVRAATLFSKFVLPQTFSKLLYECSPVIWVYVVPDMIVLLLRSPKLKLNISVKTYWFLLTAQRNQHFLRNFQFPVLVVWSCFNKDLKAKRVFLMEVLIAVFFVFFGSECLSSEHTAGELAHIRILLTGTDLKNAQWQFGN